MLFRCSFLDRRVDNFLLPAAAVIMFRRFMKKWNGEQITNEDRNIFKNKKEWIFIIYYLFVLSMAKI